MFLKLLTIIIIIFVNVSGQVKERITVYRVCII